MKNQLTTFKRGALPRFLRATSIAGLLPVIVLLLSIQSSHAGSAKWKASPATGDCNTAANWSAGGPPNGSAPASNTLYVTNQGSNNVSAYTIDASSGALTPVAGSPFGAGNGPNAVAVNANGTFAFVANQNYPNGSGSVFAYTINDTSGALTPVAGSQDADGEPYGLAIDPTGKFAYVTNLFSNTVSAYTIDATSGALTEVAGSPFGTDGGEPEGVAVDPTGKFVYVPNSETNSVAAYTINATTGALTPVAGSPFGTGTTPQGVLNVAFDPAGKFAYVTNQNAMTVSAYTINATSGALTPVAGSPFGTGNAPSAVAVDPTGKFAYVTNASDGTVSAYTINNTSGALTPLAGSPFGTGNGPVGVAVDSTGKFAYVTNSSDGTVSAYTIDATSGALAPVAGSPFGAGSGPFGIAVTARPTPTQVQGRGVLDNQGNEVTFMFHAAQAQESGTIGHFYFCDPVAGVCITNAGIRNLSITGNSAHFSGGQLQDGTEVKFKVSVTDNGMPGTSDTISIIVSDGYSLNGTLIRGDIRIY